MGDKIKYNEKNSIMNYTSCISDGSLRYAVSQLMMYYRGKALRSKYLFYSFSITIITINAVIPLLTRYEKTTSIIAAASTVGTILNGILLIVMAKDGWVRNRTTVEHIKGELLLFNTNCEPYDQDDKEQVLSKRINEIKNEDHSAWLKTIMKKQIGDEDNDDDPTDNESNDDKEGQESGEEHEDKQVDTSLAEVPTEKKE